MQVIEFIFSNPIVYSFFTFLDDDPDTNTSGKKNKKAEKSIDSGKLLTVFLNCFKLEFFIRNKIMITNLPWNPFLQLCA